MINLLMSLVFSRPKVRAISSSSTRKGWVVFALDCRQGVSLDKLDKGCLIYNMDADSGYRISIVDKTSKSTEAQYWKELFLRVAPIQKSFPGDQKCAGHRRHFVTDQIGDEFELSKAERVGYLKSPSTISSHTMRLTKRNLSRRYLKILSWSSHTKKFDAGFRSQFSMDMEPDFDIALKCVRQAGYSRVCWKLDKIFTSTSMATATWLNAAWRKMEEKFYKIYYRRSSKACRIHQAFPTLNRSMKYNNEPNMRTEPVIDMI